MTGMQFVPFGYTVLGKQKFEEVHPDIISSDLATPGIPMNTLSYNPEELEEHEHHGGSSTFTRNRFRFG
jgi:hypothetical protein